MITVDPVGLNKYSGQPSMRSYQIVVPNFWPGAYSNQPQLCICITSLDVCSILCTICRSINYIL